MIGTGSVSGKAHNLLETDMYSVGSCRTTVYWLPLPDMYCRYVISKGGLAKTLYIPQLVVVERLRDVRRDGRIYIVIM